MISPREGAVSDKSLLQQLILEATSMSPKDIDLSLQNPFPEEASGWDSALVDEDGVVDVVLGSDDTYFVPRRTGLELAVGGPEVIHIEDAEPVDGRAEEKWEPTAEQVMVAADLYARAVRAQTKITIAQERREKQLYAERARREALAASRAETLAFGTQMMTSSSQAEPVSSLDSSPVRSEAKTDPVQEAMQAVRKHAPGQLSDRTIETVADLIYFRGELARNNGWLVCGDGRKLEAYDTMSKKVEVCEESLRQGGSNLMDSMSRDLYNLIAAVARVRYPNVYNWRRHTNYNYRR